MLALSRRRPAVDDEELLDAGPEAAADTATDTSARPTLVLVPRRRRWTAVLVGFVSTLVFAGLFAAAVFHTQLAERQLRIDRLEHSVTKERERFDELRQARAELRSPAHLATVADELNMINGRTEGFMHVTPDELARQIAAAGMTNGHTVDIINRNDPLEQFRDVKAVSEGQP
jgi:hypothetical protein